ncbi:hypothetical protein VIBNIAM115_320002 [Vibrio nigripulchritudo AM115]|nr:hypothetical protein VIBNIAM115_320002 [Vibrio nigripulchritudo AM115]
MYVRRRINYFRQSGLSLEEPLERTVKSVAEGASFERSETLRQKDRGVKGNIFNPLLGKSSVFWDLLL